MLKKTICPLTGFSVDFCHTDLLFSNSLTEYCNSCIKGCYKAKCGKINYHLKFVKPLKKFSSTFCDMNEVCLRRALMCSWVSCCSLCLCYGVLFIYTNNLCSFSHTITLLISRPPWCQYSQLCFYLTSSVAVLTTKRFWLKHWTATVTLK